MKQGDIIKWLGYGEYNLIHLLQDRTIHFFFLFVALHLQTGRKGERKVMITRNKKIWKKSVVMAFILLCPSGGPHTFISLRVCRLHKQRKKNIKIKEFFELRAAL